MYSFHQSLSVRSSPQPLAAEPAGSSGVCEPGPRWPHRWDRCSSAGWDSSPSRPLPSDCGTGTPGRTPRSAYRSGSSLSWSSWSCCCQTGCWSRWSLCGAPVAMPGCGSMVRPLQLPPSWGPLGLCSPPLCRSASSAAGPGSCSRATCRSSPPQSSVFAWLSSVQKVWVCVGASHICRRLKRQRCATMFGWSRRQVSAGGSD